MHCRSDGRLQGGGRTSSMIGPEPLFFASMVMDKLTDEVRQESPCMIMSVDDIVISSESREQVEQNMESWRIAQEKEK